MRRIWICRVGLGPEDLQRLLDLLRLVGCSDEEIALFDELATPLGDVDDEVCVFLLTADAVEAPELSAALNGVPRGGRRAICIWPEGAEQVPLPEAITSFSYSIVRWGLESLKKALIDDDVTVFEGPSGGELPQEERDHKECDE